MGVKCNYQGKASSAWQEGLCSFFEKGLDEGILFVPVCPEQLGGLSTPRIPAELQNPSAEVVVGLGRVVDFDHTDVTNKFVFGAFEALRIAKTFGATVAILKSKSPSCGTDGVYDGTFSGKLVPGRGLTSELLSQAGIFLIDEKKLLAKTCQEGTPAEILRRMCTS